MTPKGLRAIIVTLVALAALFLFLGYAADDPFWMGLHTSLFTFFLGLLAAVGFVEWVSRRRAAEEWRPAAAIVHRAMHDALVHVLHLLSVDLPGLRFDPAKMPTFTRRASAQALDEVASIARQLAEMSPDDLESAGPYSFFGSGEARALVRAQLYELSTVLLPRLVSTRPDPALLEAAFRLDEAARELRHAADVWEFEDFSQDPEHRLGLAAEYAARARDVLAALPPF